MFEDALPEKTKTVLRRLSPVIHNEGFYLAGGSGLALQMGHRISDDLDFFKESSFAPTILLSKLRKGAERVEEIMVERDTLILILADVRLAFFRYDVPLLFQPVTFEGIKVADWRDITSEKFKTIALRGSKKDFYDLYAVFQSGRISIREAVETMKRRFESTGLNFYHVLRSLTYFEDADTEPEPRLINKESSWEEVKAFFTANIKEFEIP